MSKKSKSRSNPMAELNFVAHVQLEHAVQLVGDIADERHQVTLTEVSPDEYKFHINYLPNKSKVAEVSGTLQRWQGTETKIDASSYVIRLWGTEDEGVHQVSSLFFLSLVLIAAVLAVSNGILVVGLAIMTLAGVLLMVIISQAKGKADKPSVIFRARDYLLQRIIDTFKTTGEVEIYERENSSKEQTFS
jgi:hypothetical protein